MAAADQVEKEQKEGSSAAAHSPLERIAVSRGFAASVLN